MFNSLSYQKHSCAHLMISAIKSLFSTSKCAIGPDTKDGFFYDFYLDFSLEFHCLSEIENKMKILSSRNICSFKYFFTKIDSVNFFCELGEIYKLEILYSLHNKDVCLYKHDNFVDLCKGPHVDCFSELKFFKLIKVSGVYWKGNPENEVLQRVSGVLFDNLNDLNFFIDSSKIFKNYKHKSLAKKYDLFHLSEETPGMVFWHHKGFVLYNEIIKYIRRILTFNDCYEVKTPQLFDISLWKLSGHFDKYKKYIFNFYFDSDEYIVKPMSCPCHIKIFNSKIRSYKDLPMRFFEMGICHRNEPSGSLYGLMRLRNFTQDDVHVFCSSDQIYEEVCNFIKILFNIYCYFGFKNVIINLSTCIRSLDYYDKFFYKSESVLIEVLNSLNLNYKIDKHGGAFYGPKIDFTLCDSIGRYWQCGTIQVDFFTPRKLKSFYIDKNGVFKFPVLLHRAILGSIERFIGILIEDNKGNFPFWLAPVQIVILSVSSSFAYYVNFLSYFLLKKGFRVLSDIKDEKINFKIRNYILDKVPYILVIGKNEVNNECVSVRFRDDSKLKVMTLFDFLDILYSELN